MGDELRRTIKIKRREKIGTDSRGRNVWTKPVEEIEFELVSTVMLKRIIATGEQEKNDRIRDLAAGEDGVLARATNTNEFEIIRDDELEEALRAAGKAELATAPGEATLERVDEAGPEDELSLVTTQALRRILKIEDEGPDDGPEGEDPGGGYNPYDRG